MMAQEIVVLREDNAALGKCVRDVGQIFCVLESRLVRGGDVNTSQPETDSHRIGDMLIKMKPDHFPNPFREVCALAALGRLRPSADLRIRRHLSSACRCSRGCPSNRPSQHGRPRVKALDIGLRFHVTGRPNEATKGRLKQGH